MIKKITQIEEEVKLFMPSSKEEVDVFKIKYLGKTGVLSKLFDDFKTVPVSKKKEVGIALNKLKSLVKSKLSFSPEKQISGKRKNEKDLTKTIKNNSLGSRHPLAIIEQEIIEIFSSIGFALSEGPEIEDDWHNFTALNTPKEHPARDMQDTFFIQSNPDVLLRSHTSSVQVRHMEENSPPIRILSPGRVYRNEVISARAHCYFIKLRGYI